MDRKPRTCFWPLRPQVPADPKERRALRALQRPDFDPEQGYEWPARPPGPPEPRSEPHPAPSQARRPS